MDPGLVVLIVACVGLVSLAVLAVRGAHLSLKRLPPAGAAAPAYAGEPASNPARSAGMARAVSARASPLRTVRRKPRDSAEPLAPESTVNFGDERKAADIDGILASVDRDLVGLVPVKRKVEQIASLLLVDGARKRFGIDAPRPSLHMCFTGPPGTGKTTMALRLAELLHRLGYLKNGQVVHAMRDDLVGEYIGHTAPKTKRVLDRAMGGVLFIDEAYYLYRSADSKDYGNEVIDILLQVMESQRENLVVVLAGYKDRMEEFFAVNPGMRSRIAHHLDFAPYDLDELVTIGHLMLDEASYHLSPAAERTFRQEISDQMARSSFGNARSVRNTLDQARLRHADRLAADARRRWSRDDLMRLEPEDILDEEASRAADAADADHGAATAFDRQAAG
jgi:probable Rubsico expression protein CbbX